MNNTTTIQFLNICKPENNDICQESWATIQTNDVLLPVILGLLFIVVFTFLVILIKKKTLLNSFEQNHSSIRIKSKIINSFIFLALIAAFVFLGLCFTNVANASDTNSIPSYDVTEKVTASANQDSIVWSEAFLNNQESELIQLDSCSTTLLNDKAQDYTFKIEAITELGNFVIFEGSPGSQDVPFDPIYINYNQSIKIVYTTNVSSKEVALLDGEDIFSVTFNCSYYTPVKKPLVVEGKRYLPIFNAPPTNIVWYSGESEVSVASMSDIDNNNVDGYCVSNPFNNEGFWAIYTVKGKFNNIFGSDEIMTFDDINDVFRKDNNLIPGVDLFDADSWNKVESLDSPAPILHEVPVVSIQDSYDTLLLMQAFYSGKATAKLSAFFWSSNKSWNKGVRTGMNNCVVVSRKFN